jgi:hypothetical protein
MFRWIIYPLTTTQKLVKYQNLVLKSISQLCNLRNNNLIFTCVQKPARIARWMHQFSMNHWSRATLRVVSIRMGDVQLAMLYVISSCLLLTYSSQGLYRWRLYTLRLELDQGDILIIETLVTHPLCIDLGRQHRVSYIR